ncbi:hypothetical protein AB1Y20_021466 [Prymnesium parvum]|uniref:Glycerophosphocholine acyltransferase 1 n=1 Tax=Prymnesium parvum TaxID=97485 RepID=A0AB34JLL8_PRYPA
MSALVAVAAFVVQTLVVFAGNSRLFGLLKPGSGWYTNVEMSMRYASLVTPARWAFAIWGIIYLTEAAGMLHLLLMPAHEVVFLQGSNTTLWVWANAFQAAWALLFATERLAMAALALAGIAVSLTWLSLSLCTVGALEYALLAGPIWLHAGWTCAASIVNFNLVVGLAADYSAQLAAAHASAFVAAAVGVGTFLGAALSTTCSPLVAAPMIAALCWALAAIRAELKSPVLIADSKVYAEIGELGRNALQLVVGGSALVMAGSVLFITCAWFVVTRAAD